MSSLGRFFTLLTEPHKGVFRTSEKDVLGTSLRDMFLGVIYQTIWERPHNVYTRRHQDVGRRHPLVLHIGQFWDVLRTLHQDVLRTSFLNILKVLVGTFPALHGEPMGTSTERLLGTSSGHPRDLILPSGLVTI